MRRWPWQRCRPRPAPAASAATSAVAAQDLIGPIVVVSSKKTRWKTWHLQLRLALAITILALGAMLPGCYGGPTYSSRIVKTKYGSVRGVILELRSRRLEPVEVFRGVPYAAPPVGQLRFAQAQPPPAWTGTRLADTFGPVCPQRLPDLSNRTAALQIMPEGRLEHLLSLVPFLKRESEDCLNLNLYVPGSGSRGPDAPYPVIVFIHGESYEWNAGSPYEGSVLASWGHVIALTFNYRLGILGFLRTRLGSQELDLGTGDIVAVLRWVKDNIAPFGGDPSRVTLVGHDTGAVLASILLLSSTSKGLFHHMVLMSGSVMSPWALLQQPWDLRALISHQMGCHVTAPDDPDLAPCLRKLPLQALMSASVDPPRFLPRFGPSLPYPGLDPVRIALDQASDPFILTPLILGVHTTESYTDFNNQDIVYGLEEEQRNRVLRTFVRNTYVFHLNEIFSTIRNEYTDWERPVAHPINLRDKTLEALSDGHTVAPLLHFARAHAKRGSPTYVLHFAHQDKASYYPQRLGSVRGDAVPYLLGLPLVGGEPHFPRNYSHQGVAVAETLIGYICNLAKTGSPNDPQAEKQNHKTEEERGSRASSRDVLWKKYNLSTQLYLSLTQKPKMKSHYRGHRIAVWLDLVPQLHRAGGQDVGMRHHHFHEKGDRYFSGSVRAESATQFPPIPDFLMSTVATAHECSPLNVTGLAVEEGNELLGPAEEDGRELEVTASDSDFEDNDLLNEDDESGLLQKLSAGHLFNSSLALGITLGAGGLLLILNILVLVAILYQRAKKARRRKREQAAEEGINTSTTAPSGPSPSSTPLTALGVATLPRTNKHQNGPLDVLQVGGTGLPRYSVGMPVPVPAPPPPPRLTAPIATVSNVSAVAGPATGTTSRQGGIKKRVQIQEISV